MGSIVEADWLYYFNRGKEWGRRGLPASMWLNGSKPSGFAEGHMRGLAAWRSHLDCPDCGRRLTTEPMAIKHWPVHAPRAPMFWAATTATTT